jgi:hypothetical protein
MPLGFDPSKLSMGRYEECDRCGERYWNDDIERYLRDEGNKRVCCTKKVKR